MDDNEYLEFKLLDIVTAMLDNAYSKEDINRLVNQAIKEKTK